MASRYLMQIVDRNTNEAVQFEPGRRVELEFVDDCVARVLRQAKFTLADSTTAFIDTVVEAVLKRGVAFKSTYHVEQDLRDGLREVIIHSGLDKEVKVLQEELGHRVRLAIESAIQNLKTQIVP